MDSWRALEEIAKLEQRTALRHGNFLTLFNTPSVKSLNKKEKEAFFQHLRRKKRANKIVLSISILSLLGILLIKSKLTGNVILNEGGSTSIASLLLVVFLFMIIIMFGLKLRERHIKNRFKSHISLLER
ncbi:MAG: hypothetical protein AABX66_02725 [Nanoarchaeota archaeon]